MPSIGDTLREALMRRKMDVADVEARTKIRAKYLRALENEEWGALPGHTFVKTFLRTYAEVVGVDPHLLVEEYRTTQEAQEDELDVQPRAGRPAGGRRESRRRPPRGPPSKGALVAALAVTVVAFLLVLGLVSGGDDDSDSDKGASPGAQTQTTQARRRAPKRRRRSAAAASGVTVRIAPTVPTYACLDTGEGTGVVFEGTLEGPRTFRHAKRLRVNLGKRALDLRVNGKRVRIPPSPEPVGSPGSTDQPLRRPAMLCATAL